MLLSLAVGATLAGIVALAGTAQQAEAALTEKIVFSSTRTTGTGVNNPTGDYEIFKMNPDGTGLRQLTSNTANEYFPVLSPDGKKIAYASLGKQTSNPEGDSEVYRMNALDGSGKKNLSNNGDGINDSFPGFSPGGQKIAYLSNGIQTTNPEGDDEIYLMNALDGSDKKNLSNNGDENHDFGYDFSPDGQKIAYTSHGDKTTNPEGDREIYLMSALDGSDKKNLSDNSINDESPDFSPDGQKIAYLSYGIQTTNPEGDREIYLMSALDGSGKKNLSNNGAEIHDELPVFSPGGQKIAYTSKGIQTSNPQGDSEVYRMNALDGAGKKNLSNNAGTADDVNPVFSPYGQKIVYTSYGKQTSNPQGDSEVYRVNVLDGTDKKNLTDNGADDNYADWGVQGM